MLKNAMVIVPTEEDVVKVIAWAELQGCKAFRPKYVIPPSIVISKAEGFELKGFPAIPLEVYYIGDEVKLKN